MKELIAVSITLGLVVLLISQQSPRDTLQPLPELPRFTIQDVAGFSIFSQGKEVLKARKEGERWLLVAHDAPAYLQTKAVEQLLHDLQTMQAKRVVTRKTELFQRFAVDEHEVVLQDKQGHVLLDVFVGKPATDLVSTYIRLADDKRVLTVDKVLTWQVKRTLDAWLNTKEESPE